MDYASTLHPWWVVHAWWIYASLVDLCFKLRLLKSILSRRQKKNSFKPA